MGLVVDGITIPDTKLAREVTELVRVLFRCPGRAASRAEIRPGAAVYWRHVSRHGADASVQQ